MYRKNLSRNDYICVKKGDKNKSLRMKRGHTLTFELPSLINTTY